MKNKPLFLLLLSKLEVHKEVTSLHFYNFIYTYATVWVTSTKY